MQYNDDNLFNLYLAKINDAYIKDNNYAKDIIKNYCDRLDDNKKSKKFNINLGKNVELLALICCCFLILLLGLFKINTFPMYFFGWIFFVAGVLVGMYVPVFGIIFLFSHGMTGLFLMLNFLNIEEYLVYVSDSPTFVIYLLIAIIVFLFVAGIVFAILHSFKKNREKKFFSCYPFICFFLLILILIFIPNIISLFS